MAKFIRRGRSKIYFLPTVAAYTGLSNTSSPTSSEITAGTDLSLQLNAVDGFMYENQTVDAPILASSLTPKIPGEDTIANSKLTFLDEDNSSSIRTLLAKDVNGYIVLMPYGRTATKRCEVWQVTSTGCNDEYQLGNEPARFQVTFAIQNPPSQNGVLP